MLHKINYYHVHVTDNFVILSLFMFMVEANFVILSKHMNVHAHMYYMVEANFVIYLFIALQHKC